MSGNIQANSNFSPSFIKAKTPEELETLMLKNNLVSQRVYHYREISFAGGFWYAWYDRDNSARVRIQRKEKTRGDN